MAFWSALLARPTRTPLQARPSLTLFFCLVGAFLLTLLPHVEQLPFWVSLSVALAMLVRSIMEFYRLPLPSTLFCSILAICLLAGILFQFNTMFGREAGTAFMSGLLAIKFFELRGPRDIAVIIFSSFFMVMSALLYSQALELFIYCLIMMWVLTALLVRIQIGDLPEDRLSQMLGRAGIVFLQALPLTIFLFFFFPRFPGKLQMSLSETSLGLTDTVRPGSIAQLSRDDSTAMYVRFIDGDVPSIDAMYWRALVLWQYREGIWTRGPLAEVPEELPSPAPGSKPVAQEITIWPHNQRWLFALDSPVKPASKTSDSSPFSIKLDGAILQLNDPSYPNERLDHRERYTVTSATDLAPQRLNASEKLWSVQLPGSSPNDSPFDRIDPDVAALADQLHQENPDSQAYAMAVLHYFRHGGFHYSAAPGATEKGDWLHNFLFVTKTGFCEHFASAFAVLMRQENIPARLVVGYQGAEYNPYDNTYIVKQSNAHVWDEVWLDSKKNWIRIDPTSVLGPGVGAQQSSNNSQNETDEGDLSIQVAHIKLTLLSGSTLPHWMHSAVVEMQLRRQQIETNWDDLVFSYNNEAQSRLAQAMGFGRDAGFMLALASLLAIGTCAIVLKKWMKQKKRLTPVENFYAAFCQHMAQSGVPRAAWEGPLAYTRRVAEAFPEQKEAIQDVGLIVAHSRYGPSPIEPSSPKELQSLLSSISSAQAASSSREQKSTV